MAHPNKARRPSKAPAHPSHTINTSNIHSTNNIHNTNISTSKLPDMPPHNGRHPESAGTRTAQATLSVLSPAAGAAAAPTSTCVPQRRRTLQRTPVWVAVWVLDPADSPL
jgi:hypothetical protein